MRMRCSCAKVPVRGNSRIGQGRDSLHTFLRVILSALGRFRDDFNISLHASLVELAIDAPVKFHVVIAGTAPARAVEAPAPGCAFGALHQGALACGRSGSLLGFVGTGLAE